jgi:hypothetical protein
VITNEGDKLKTNIPECLREPLMKAAHTLFNSDEATFEDLTPAQQKLWNTDKPDQIYRFLMGEPDMIPEFRFNWIMVPSARLKVSVTLTQFSDSTRDTSISQTNIIPTHSNTTITPEFKTSGATMTTTLMATKNLATA